MLIWYVLHIRPGFVPVTIKKLRQMNLQFIVPTNGRDIILAKFITEQCASVSFIVGVMGINECATEILGLGVSSFLGCGFF
jgi:hypothetical protein